MALRRVRATIVAVEKQQVLHILSETFLVLRKTERDMIRICIVLHVKYPLFVSDFNEL